MSLKHSLTFKTFNASLLIAGTCIGGGMLALPLTSGSIGFFPSILIMLACCVFMTITGLLYLEATLWMKENAHMNTLSTNLLSKFGQFVCWAVYLFICYASLVAYISGGGKEIAFVMRVLFDYDFQNISGLLIFSFLFCSILFFGHSYSEKTNTILFIIMIVAYVLLIINTSSNLNKELLLRQNWSSSFIYVFPLMLTTFSFPGIVPTITSYLERDTKCIKIAILSGTSLTFIVYFIWLLIIFGSVSFKGEHGLEEAFKCDIPATECLHYALKNPLISLFAQIFAFFALATSFIGISLSLLDFLRDSIKINGSEKSKNFIFLILLIAPSLFFAIFFERAFIVALEMSGGIGDAIISGIIPVVMIWNGRYFYKKIGSYTVSGGKLLLIIIFICSLTLLCFEVFRRIF